MEFTEREKVLTKQLKEAGLKWEPQEGDWFWAAADFTHQFYLGESLPSSYTFQTGETYVFDSSMTWHIQQGGLNPDRLTWLPAWKQCRNLFKRRGFSLLLQDQDHKVILRGRNGQTSLESEGSTDLEAAYSLLLKILQS